MAKEKGKLSCIGQVWEAKDSTKENPKFFVKLGKVNDARPEFDLHVELVVKDSQGNVVTTQTDGFLTLADPRKNPYAKPEHLEKVPNLQFDVLVRNS